MRSEAIVVNVVIQEGFPTPSCGLSDTPPNMSAVIFKKTTQVLCFHYVMCTFWQYPHPHDLGIQGSIPVWWSYQSGPRRRVTPGGRGQRARHTPGVCLQSRQRAVTVLPMPWHRRCRLSASSPTPIFRQQNRRRIARPRHGNT